MFSSSKFNSFFALVLILPILFLNSCGIEKSEYGKKSDYQKLGYTCPGFTDISPPTATSEIPTDNTTYNSVDTTVSVTFSEALATSSITTNTSDTTCSGTFQLSSDNFTTCIKMSAAPVASNDNKTFTVTPASNLSAGTTFKRRVTSPIADTSCNFLASDNTSIVGFSTSPTGAGIISGSVQNVNGSALSGVNVSFNLLANDSDSSGRTVGDTNSVDNGTFSQSSLVLGIYTLTYSKNDYLDATLTDTLESDGHTIVETIRLLPSTCDSGEMSGKITDAVSSDNISGVRLFINSGMNNDHGAFTYFDTTDENGNWSRSNTSPGWYTIKARKTGYYNDNFNVYSCGNQSNQNNSLSTELDPGAMRIMLDWPTTDPATGDDFDSHLYIPFSGCSGASDKDDKCHLWYMAIQSTAVTYKGESTTTYHIYDNDTSDLVMLDRDAQDAPGTETITISKVRSGTYSYSIHNFDDSDLNTGDADAKKTNFRKSRAKIKAIYNDGTTVHVKRFPVPDDNGTLWTVFTFDKDSSGKIFTRVQEMSFQSTAADIY